MFSLPHWQSALVNLKTRWFGRLASALAATPAEKGRLRLSTRSLRFAWALYGVACFLVFLVLTFPADLLLQRVVASIERTAMLRIAYGESRWTWNKGWILLDVSIDKPGMTPLRLSRFTLAPSIGGLLQGRPFPLTFSALLYGGAARGVLHYDNSAYDLQFSLEQIALEHWPFPPPWGQGRMSGALTAEGSLHGVAADIATWSGALTASLVEGALKAGSAVTIPLPPLRAVQARLQATCKNGRIEVSDLTLEADGVTARLQGAVALRSPLEWSALDLQLTARQTGAPPPGLAALVSLLPVAPGGAGERKAALTGTLAAPALR
jgi:type II secretion system protein N